MHRQAQPVSQGSLFCLPLELRRMVYSLLIPLPKKLRPYGRYRRPTCGYGPKQWGVYFDNFRRTIRPPVLTQVCFETRTYMLEIGSFIFTKPINDGGLWWNHEQDSLEFTKDFHVRLEQYVFEDLGGLQHVRKLSFDAYQSIHLAYNAQYTSVSEVEKPVRERDINAVKLCFLARNDDDEDENWLTRCFPQATYFEIDVTNPIIIFDLEQDREEEVKHNLAELAEFWFKYSRSVSRCGLYEPFYPRMTETYGSSLEYFTKPGRKESDNPEDWVMHDAWEFPREQDPW
ncbi:hypothetical protein N0V93_008177 [Gnomoniopsis smithogilvyi]|uniref:2EXR domain-containing protein n=1 Tax=Gnomoniopsis smithogilvyi TaxID=1191159 RepID=A0A9W8YPU9_9PEZI|nr:hypothetical protein N0V93_008177 [Gnomoniopsis smithogilvyi]